MAVSLPAAWYPDPEHPSQYRYWDGQQWTDHRAPDTIELSHRAKPTARREKWNTSENWATFGTAFVMVPVTSLTARAAVDAGVSDGAVAAVAAAVAVAAFVLLNRAGRTRHGVLDGVLFGLYLTFTLSAIYATAKALDVSELWVMVAVVVPMLALAWWRYRHGEKSPA